MATNNTTELYTILVQTSGSTAAVRQLVTQLDRSNRALQSTQKATRGVSQAMGTANRSLNQSRIVWQNAGYQVQDFFVQVSGGTGVLRSLGQQLPQLTSAFGIWGVAIGTAVAALGGLIPLLTDTKDAASATSEAMDDLAASAGLLATLTATMKAANDLRETVASSAASNSARTLDSLRREIEARQVILRLDRLAAERDLAQRRVQISDLERDLARREQEARDRVQSQFQTGAQDLQTAQDFLAVQQRLNDEMAIWRRENRSAIEDTARNRAELTLLEVQFQSLNEALDDTGAALMRMREGGSFETFLPPPDRAEAALKFLEAAQEAISAVETEQDRARAAAERFRAALEAVARGAVDLRPDEVHALRQALSDAEVAAMGLSDAISDVQRRMDALDASGLATAVEGAAAQAQLAALQAGAAVDEARIQSRLIQEAATLYPDAAAENLEFIVQSTPALQKMGEALRDNAAIEQQINDLLKKRREDEKPARGGAGRSRANDAERELRQAEAAIQRFIASQRTASEVVDATIADIQENLAKLPASWEGLAELTDGAAEALRRYRTQGIETVQDFIEGQRGQAEAMKDTVEEIRRVLAGLKDDMPIEEWQDLQEAAEQAIGTMQRNARELDDISQTIHSNFTSAFDAILDGTKSVGEAFSDMVKGIAKDLAALVVSRAFQEFLFALAGSGGTGGTSAGSWVSQIFNPARSLASGGVPAAAPLSRSILVAANSNSPHAYGANVAYVNPAPPIRSSYAGQEGRGGIVVNVVNNADAEIGARESTGPNGEMILDITVEKKVREVFARGSMDGIMQSSYGIRRRPT